MKIGTLWCRLWGHKFLWKGTPPEDQKNLGYGEYITVIKKINYCVRCGITREELK